MATSTKPKAKKPRKTLPQWRKRNPDPTPAEIAAACAAIRATWSEATRQQRLMVPDRVAWAPPVVTEAELLLDASPAWD